MNSKLKEVRNMINLETDSIMSLTKIVGIGLMIFGLVWSFIERYLCRFLCNTCTNWQLSPCFLLFLFVGIIFILVGFSLTKIPLTRLPKMEIKRGRRRKIALDY